MCTVPLPYFEFHKEKYYTQSDQSILITKPGIFTLLDAHAIG